MTVGHKATELPHCETMRVREDGENKTNPAKQGLVMVETTRLELVTSTMSTWRSNQLGYASITLIFYTKLRKLTSVLL